MNGGSSRTPLFFPVHGHEEDHALALRELDGDNIELKDAASLVALAGPHCADLLGAGELVAPGGRYAALMFPVGRPLEEGGPPFGMDGAAVMDALGSVFRRVEEGDPERPVAKRPWRERWLLAERARLATQR